MISLTSPVETAAHRWPAGAKLAVLCGATVVLFIVESLAVQAAFLLCAFVLYLMPGQMFLRAGLRALLPLWPFTLLILLWHGFTSDFAGGVVIVMRMLTAVALANLVTLTTRLSDMMKVVQRLTAPLRWIGISTRPIEVAMALVIRFTPVLAVKGQMLAQAWRARSTRAPGWRIIMPFAVTAIDDAEQVAEALRARGGL